VENLIEELDKTVNVLDYKNIYHNCSSIDANTRLLVSAILILIKTIREQKDGQDNS
jgi:hypothetical protein